MLRPDRALNLNSTAGRPLPHVEALEPLYEWGCTPRHGQVIMIAGRSGSQKSGFALWLVDELDLSTLYFSADMSAFTASSRVASKRTSMTTEGIEASIQQGGEVKQSVLDAMAESKITFSFGSPITWRQVEQELHAYVELWDAWPDVMVFDNLMDFEGAEADYAAQMEVMQILTELARETGSTVIVMHHASDKSWDAKTNPWNPPSRDQIKNGLSEKSELCLSVALDANTYHFNIAVVKQRMGRQDPTGTRWVTIQCVPELTQFKSLHDSRRLINAGSV